LTFKHDGKPGHGPEELPVKDTQLTYTITLDPSNPYVARYLNRDAVATRYRATLALVQGDRQPYLDWWNGQTKQDIANRQAEDWNADKAADYYEAMVERIRTEGYDPQTFANWNEDGRDETSPITARVGACGDIWVIDGHHRALALWAMGRPAPATVTYRHPEWTKAIEWVDTVHRYQPHPHPDLQGIGAIRPDTANRYRDIGYYLVSHDITSAFEVGSSHGVGCLAMASTGLSVTGMDSVPANYFLADGLYSNYPNLNLTALQGETPPVCFPYEALVGLSVHHHLGNDLNTLDRWIRATSPARCQIIELPEPASTRWSQQLLADLGSDYDTITEAVLNRIAFKGNYTRRESLGTDPRYGHRETVALWR